MWELFLWWLVLAISTFWVGGAMSSGRWDWWWRR